MNFKFRDDVHILIKKQQKIEDKSDGDATEVKKYHHRDDCLV